MKEKWFRRCLFLGLGFSLILPGLAAATPAAPPSPSSEVRPSATDHHHMAHCIQNVALTEPQKKELQQIYARLNSVNKELIDAYTRMGVLAKEQQARKLKRMEAFMQNLQANRFLSCIKVSPGELEYEIPGVHHHHMQHHWRKSEENSKAENNKTENKKMENDKTKTR